MYGDGANPRRDHLLDDGEVLAAVHLHPPVAGERSAYVRVAGRALAEWPYVEVVARVALDAKDRVSFARVSLGGVANIPIRLERLERDLIGNPLDRSIIETRATAAVADFAVVADTRYKLEMIPVAIADAFLNPPTAPDRIDWALPFRTT